MKNKDPTFTDKFQRKIKNRIMNKKIGGHMFKFIKNKITYLKNSASNQSKELASEKNENSISHNLNKNIHNLQEKYHNSADLVIKEININGRKIAFITIESMVDMKQLSEMVLRPIMNFEFKDSHPVTIQSFIEDNLAMGVDIKVISHYDEIFHMIMSGSVAILIDGCEEATVFSMVGYTFRSPNEPSGETNIRGSREGFCEVIRINLTMVRRRLKSNHLKFEILQVGKKSKTDVCLMYLTDTVEPELVNYVKKGIEEINLDVILDTGYLIPFLEGKPFSIFSDIGTTERPDIVCSKLVEGRIALLVDGSPFAIFLPFFFSDNFQNLDDYTNQPIYVSMLRILKYFAFAISSLLPGLYVALGNQHPELLPQILLYRIATSEQTTAFPLIYQALIFAIIYEIMREAGLRLPRPVGTAVSIIGALVIGDAAVQAGLIGTPMVMIIALTAISEFVIPSLHIPLSFLRITFIVLGATLGLYGISLGICGLFINLCSRHILKYPFMEPLSPFTLKSIKDSVIKFSFRNTNSSIDSINPPTDQH